MKKRRRRKRIHYICLYIERNPDFLYLYLNSFLSEEEREEEFNFSFQVSKSVANFWKKRGEKEEKKRKRGEKEEKKGKRREG